MIYSCLYPSRCVSVSILKEQANFIHTTTISLIILNAVSSFQFYEPKMGNYFESTRYSGLKIL